MYSASRKGPINRNRGFLDAVFAGWTSLYCSSLRLKLVNSTRLWFRKVVLHLIREASSVEEVKQDRVSAEEASSLLLSGILSPSKGCSPSSGLQAGESSAEPLTWSYRSGHHCSCYHGNTSTATTAPAAATSSSTTTISTIISNICKRYSAHSMLSWFTWNRYMFAWTWFRCRMLCLTEKQVKNHYRSQVCECNAFHCKHVSQ